MATDEALERWGSAALVEGLSNHPFPVLDDNETRDHLARFYETIERLAVADPRRGSGR